VDARGSSYYHWRSELVDIAKLATALIEKTTAMGAKAPLHNSNKWRAKKSPK